MTTTTGIISPEVRALAIRIADLQRAVNDRTTQLDLTALEDGAIREFSLDGTMVAQYGKQYDGTSGAATLVSPPPPAPSTPTVTGVQGGIRVAWDGTFENDITVVAPMDWDHVDIVIGPVGMDPIATPPSGTFTSARGGDVFLPKLAGAYAVALVTRTTAGRASDPSLVVGVTALAAVTQDQIDAIDAAVAEAQAAADQAQSTADAIPDTVAQAKADAIATASGDATTKADAAKAGAIASAAADATTKASNAQAAAIAAAASDATSKANQAQQAAITAAATDAQTKATQAKNDAIAAAALTAQQKADLAQANALAGAATDATTKANNAQSAAIAAAASDATSKANTAQAAAIAAAATDATNKDTTVLSTSKLYVQSRSTNLITNGTGLLGDNTNFSNWTYTGADAPDGVSGSFLSVLGSSNTLMADELVPVDTSKRTRLQFQARQTGTSTDGRMYGFVQAYDAGKLPIDPGHTMFTAGTTTTLAAPLNPGDTTVTLTSSANWYGSSAKPAGASIHLRRIIFWDFVDAAGKAWPQETYSRNVTATDFWADGGITGNVITLRAAYNGPAKPAGTKVSNGSSGGTYIYGGAVNTAIPKTWTTYGDTITGVAQGGAGASFGNGWPYGTAYARVGWLLNRTAAGPADANSRHAVASVAFGETVAALYDANNITTTQITDNAITSPKVLAGAIVAGKLAAGAVIAGNIAADAVTATTIAAGAVIAGKLAADSVAATNLIAGSVIAGKLAANSVIAGNIATDAVTAGTVAAGAIIAGKLAADSVLAANIKAGEVVAGKLAAAAVIAGNIATDAVTANTIAASAVTAGKIATNAVTAGTIAANAVTAGTLAASVVSAANIAAGAITAREIAIGDLTNMAELNESNPGAVSYGWTTAMGGTSNQWFTRTGTRDAYFMFRNQKGPLPFKTGDRIRLTFEAYASAAVNATASLWTYGPGGNASQAIGLGSSITLTTTPKTFAVESDVTIDTLGKTTYLIGITAPAFSTTDVFVRNVSARRMGAGELLVDGSIIAGKMAANSVVAGNIAADAVTATTVAAGAIIAGKIATDAVLAANIKAGEVTAGKLAANAVIAGNIAANAVTAGTIAAGAITTDKLDAAAINGMTITGAVLQTSATATTTGGIIIDTANGLRGYSSTGGLMTYLSPTGVLSTFGGLLSVTGSNGAGLQISPSANGGRSGIQFTNSSADTGKGSLLAGDGTSYPVGSISLGSGEATLNSTGRAELNLLKGGDFKLLQQFGANDQTGIQKVGADVQVSTNLVLPSNTGWITAAGMRPVDTGFVGGVVSSTSTNFTGYTTGPGIYFTAPPSGMVRIDSVIYCKSTTDGQYSEFGPELRTGATIGSGTVVQTAADLTVTSNQWARYNIPSLFTGLTPGAQYNVRLVYRAAVAGNAAAQLSGSRLIWTPCM